jgi:hypothetical protein
MMFTTRDWSVAAIGGHYGFIETEFVALSGEHVGWETLIAFGPFHFALPCRAPVAVVLCAIASAIAGWLAIIIFSRIKKRALKHANAA